MGDRRISRKEMCSARVLPSINECTRDDGTNTDTTGDGKGLKKTPGKKYRGN